MWKPFDILRNVELALDNEDTANKVWLQSVEAFYAYRGTGAHNQFPSMELVERFVTWLPLVSELLNNRARESVICVFDKLFVALTKSENIPVELKLMAKMRLILEGQRGDDLWHDVELHYSCAVEIRLILEMFEGDEKPPGN